MVTDPAPSIRAAELPDRPAINALLARAAFRHQHLDWLTPPELLGSSPYLLALQGQRPHALLACPPDPATIAWLRLFSVAAQFPLERTWKSLWQAAHHELHQSGVQTVLALLQERWLAPLLVASGFRPSIEVVVLDTRLRGNVGQDPGNWKIREMEEADLSQVCALDHAAFSPIWQNSPRVLEKAFSMASSATICVHQGLLVGYQISTSTTLAAHLARLGVHPEFQKLGIGRSLVQNLMQQAFSQGSRILTVNTQADNLGAINLYHSLGFRPSGGSHSVYQLQLQVD